ncbi:MULTISPECIES: XVIPCD domain-containing protein [unclassified Lysobacter]|uniref:XVIPCD domain-containing protein n=1 Tax=unclassified Lysobacter TaxID=2635362 RepID=UPI001BE8317C|nr:MULTISPECIES: XVIPCD domain-containing protein [unclassified Lysobacter]MBT2746778.1 peptidoglycan-binding protein [Lysobacter sp. ISL-42]MBT2751827.1 peptidoglycan-binding protein [Lysobacter sp. ISL-50]MBT2778179.1 peptidoglycan-binding protein [Lysobacter sp. ISL-54]MBT2781820.1 peptidoglycan-binding protein [Lysobacter sp. ISL-52]
MGKKEEFIADLYPAAMRVSKQTGMSAELILAQAALETGWGEKVLPGTNNIFNIKDSKGWDGPSKTFNVWEIEGGKKVWKDQDFRVYGSIDEALTDRVKFLKENGRYAKAGLFEEGTLGNLEKEAKALQKAGYATDPGYAKQLGEVFNGPTMRRGIALANSRDHGGPDHVEPKPADAKTAPAKPVDAMADGKLKLGEEGKAVTALQERLNELGFRDAKGQPLKPDGDFGANTKHAVQAFQRAHGLDDDGVAGSKTLDALKKAGQTTLLSDPANRDNPMYQQALQGLEKLGPQAGFKNREELERAAGTLTYEARVSGLTKIDHVSLSANGNGLFAVQGELADPANKRVHADKAQAAGQSLERSSQQLQQDVPQTAAVAAPEPEKTKLQVA